jgi:hypothetical protein
LKCFIIKESTTEVVTEAPEVTTKVPISDVEKAIQAQFDEFGATALLDGDITYIVNEHLKIVESYGINQPMVRPFFDSMASLISNISENPTEDDKAQIIQKADDVLSKGRALVTSEPGLENAYTDSALMSKPENQEFYQSTKVVENILDAVKRNPAAGLDYLADTAFAHHSYLVLEFLKRNRQVLTTTSELKFFFCCEMTCFHVEIFFQQQQKL